MKTKTEIARAYGRDWRTLNRQLVTAGVMIPKTAKNLTNREHAEVERVLGRPVPGSGFHSEKH